MEINGGVDMTLNTKVSFSTAFPELICVMKHCMQIHVPK